MKIPMIIALIICSVQLQAQLDSVNQVQEEEMIPGRGTPVDEDQIFQIVQEMPVFPGGEGAMYDWMAEEMKYPEEAREAGYQGLVYLNFIINKDGCIDDKIVVMRGVKPSLDEEAIRVIKAMPCWEPGKQRGEAVRTYYRMPIKFLLD